MAPLPGAVQQNLTLLSGSFVVTNYEMDDSILGWPMSVKRTNGLHLVGENLLRKGVPDLVIFIVHGYGSTYAAIRQELFKWLGKLDLATPKIVWAIGINWDNALSYDSDAWLSANWISRMNPRVLLNSVERAKCVGGLIIQECTDPSSAFYDKLIGLISHSMGTHATNLVSNSLGNKVAFNLLLNPHLYREDFDSTLTNTETIIIANDNDSVLKSSGNIPGIKQSLGDLRNSRLWPTALNLKVRDNCAYFVIGGEEAKSYDSSLRHGSYKHPIAPTLTFLLIQGALDGLMTFFLPNWRVWSRGLISQSWRQTGIDSVEIKLEELSISQLYQIDCYLNNLRQYYQYECPGAPFFVLRKVDESPMMYAQMSPIQESMRVYDGVDWLLL